jgi:antirestriction protein ArdC
MKADLYQRITNRIVADLLLELGVRVRALRVEPVQERAHCAPTERNTANSWQKATFVLSQGAQHGMAAHHARLGL